MRWMVNGLDITQRVKTAAWSGSIGHCARELSLGVAMSANDPNLPPLDLPLFCHAQAYADDGRRIFVGQVVRRKRDSDNSVVDLTALDGGFQLSQNQGWYSLAGTTPEAAVAAIARDFGFQTGVVASAGVSLSRKFPGVALHQIVDTMYTLAGERTGHKYQIRFEEGALCVRVKPSSSALTLAPKVNIVAASYDEDATACTNSVAIYSETGALIRTVNRAADQRLAGLLQAVVIQRSGDDAGAEAERILTDGEVQQHVTVECVGDLGLITGEAVTVRETSSGVKGLFWIDADTHTWKNGLHLCRLTLNFRNLMNDTSAGQEV